MSIAMSLRGCVVACLWTAVIAGTFGCAQEEDDLDGEEVGEKVAEEVAEASLASTFACDPSFGAIGDALYLAGELVLPNGNVESVTTFPIAGSSLQCAGGPVTIQWQPIKVKVPVGAATTGKIILRDFVVFGTPPGGPCPPVSACYLDLDGDFCADDTDLLWFQPKTCTVAAFKSGACGLSAASANICGSL
jgi:hypothetical protein